MQTLDMIVIGAGLAGLSAANRAAQSGLKVMVLEQSSDEAYLCNSRYTGGLFHIAMDDMLAKPEAARANLEAMTSGETKPELADALVANAERTINWLKSMGIKFIVAGHEGFRRNSLAPPGVRQTGLNWRGRAGDVMLRTLEKQLARHGGCIIRGVEAKSLIMEDGRCVGVEAEIDRQKIEYRAHAVVIADGGFQANPELVARFISKRPDRLLQRNAQSGKGAGIKMAESVGAALVGMDRFYGHIQHRDAMTDQGLWPYPVLDSLATAAIVVDGNGHRFCDEGGGGIYVTNEIARIEDPLSAVIIFDKPIWEGPGTDWLLPANPYLLSAGGKVIKADSIEALAKAIGIDAQALSKTIADYNDSLESGTPAAGQPARSTTKYKAWPIKTGPFYAVPVCAGVTYTMGGIAIDGNMRVLDGQGSPIRGLFAAGATTGGLEGGGYAGYSGGLSKASVFGMLAGEAVATESATVP
ncbi:MAG: FAD-dependent oxidoreductase [Pseudomonadota bacterium]